MWACFIFQNADCGQQRTVHVDAFLYDDELVDALCEEGKLSNSYCLQCGSDNTRPLSKYQHLCVVVWLASLIAC
jgi:hypothetical protein